MKQIKLTTLLIVFTITVSKSQEIITNFLTSTVNDSETLIEGYIEPFGSWLGSGLNSGWYNTAQSHRFPGFNITGGVHFITPGDNAQFFTPELETLVIDPSSNGELATFLGPENGTAIGYDMGQGFQVLFNSPSGINYNGPVPMPYIQGGIGLIKNTEILFRVAPKIKLEDLSVSHWGVGFKHGIKQWIPGIKLLPFDLSLIAGYSILNGKSEFGNNQDLKLDVKAFNSNIVLSKKISIFTPYIGVGYQYSGSSIKLNGTYNVLNINGNTTEVTNPIDISFGGVNGFKANIGARLKLLLFTLHAEWTMSEFNVFTIGVGLHSDIGSRLIGKKIEKGLSKNKKD